MSFRFRIFDISQLEMKQVPVAQIVLSLLLIFSSVSFLSCSHEPADFLLNDTICFDTQVLPLLQNSCGTTGCHDAETAEEGFMVIGYESIITAVNPGEPRKSKLYTSTTNIWSDDMMPPDNPLSAEQRNIIQIWILQGAKNTVCDTVEGSGSHGIGDTICFQQHILPIFTSGCGTTGCHDAASHAEGYILTSYLSIMDDPEGIVPGNANNSEIFEVITKEEEGDRMPPPPRAPLTNEQINMIRSWINSGALNSDCPDSSCDTVSAISFSTQVYPILQNNCTSCHTPPSGSGGIFLNNHSNVVATAGTERGGITLLQGSIRHYAEFAYMPPSSTLNECSIRIIEQWIDQGMSDN